MKLSSLCSFACIMLCFCSCEPQANKTSRKLDELSKDYVRNMDNAQTKEEAIRINKEYEDRVKFEAGKLTEDEVREYGRNQTWEDHQQKERLRRERYDARQRAKKRFRN